MIKNIYIAGAISSDKDFERKFEQAHQYLKQKGFTPVNPVELEKIHSELKRRPLTYKEIMRIDVEHLSHCDAVFMLDGWEKSPGAKAEHSLAVANGIEIFYQKTI